MQTGLNRYCKGACAGSMLIFTASTGGGRAGGSKATACDFRELHEVTALPPFCRAVPVLVSAGKQALLQRTRQAGPHNCRLHRWRWLPGSMIPVAQCMHFSVWRCRRCNTAADGTRLGTGSRSSFSRSAGLLALVYYTVQHRSAGLLAQVYYTAELHMCMHGHAPPRPAFLPILSARCLLVSEMHCISRVAGPSCARMLDWQLPGASSRTRLSRTATFKFAADVAAALSAASMRAVVS